MYWVFTSGNCFSWWDRSFMGRPSTRLGRDQSRQLTWSLRCIILNSSYKSIWEETSMQADSLTLCTSILIEQSSRCFRSCLKSSLFWKKIDWLYLSALPNILRASLKNRAIFDNWITWWLHSDNFSPPKAKSSTQKKLSWTRKGVIQSNCRAEFWIREVIDESSIRQKKR